MVLNGTRGFTLHFRAFVHLHEKLKQDHNTVVITTLLLLTRSVPNAILSSSRRNTKYMTVKIIYYPYQLSLSFTRDPCWQEAHNDNNYFYIPFKMFISFYFTFQCKATKPRLIQKDRH